MSSTGPFDVLYGAGRALGPQSQNLGHLRAQAKMRVAQSELTDHRSGRSDLMRSEYWLAHGPHATPEDGRCAMEWVSYLAGEPHSDQPACVSPALRAFCVALNDGLEKHARQRLRPYLARTIGTTHDGLDEQRSWMAMDWLIRVYAPAWLELAGVTDAARGLAVLAPVRGVGDLAAALETLEPARRDARDALRTALRGSHVARALPAAAGRSARRAAWASGEPAVWVVVRIPVGGAAGEIAREQVRAAAGDCAAAFRQTRGLDGGPSSRAAARDALITAGAALHQSAFALLDRMLPTEALAPAPADVTDGLAAA